MITVTSCAAVIVILCVLFWDEKNKYKATIAFLVTAGLFCFGIIFPFVEGASVAQEYPPIQLHETKYVDGKVYYLNNGNWDDILSIVNIYQADELRVITRKAPPSIFYWSLPYKEAYIPIKMEVQR